MNRNDLKLNEHKTEVVLISSKFRDGPSLGYVSIGNEKIPLSDKAASLGVVLDKQMSFDHHMKHLCKSLVCQFRNLFKIRKYLNKEPAATFVYAFITSKLDFCNSLFYGLPNHQLRKLQLLQNMAARFVSGARKFDYIRPILVKLHCLPISYRVVFKLLLLVFKALHGIGPRYLVELLKCQNHSRTLRSNSLERLLQQKSNTKTHGDRAFSTCAPRLWNNIPVDIRRSNSVSTFKTEKFYRPTSLGNLLITV